MCPQSRAVATATPSSRALGITRSRSRCAWTWPNPHCPSHNDGRWRLVLDLEVDPMTVLTPLDKADILRHAHHSVRVVAPQVRPDQAGRDDRRLVGRDADGRQQVGGESGQFLGKDRRHWGPPRMAGDRDLRDSRVSDRATPSIGRRTGCVKSDEGPIRLPPRESLQTFAGARDPIDEPPHGSRFSAEIVLLRCGGLEYD